MSSKGAFIFMVCITIVQTTTITREQLKSEEDILRQLQTFVKTNELPANYLENCDAKEINIFISRLCIPERLAEDEDGDREKTTDGNDKTTASTESKDTTTSAEKSDDSKSGLRPREPRTSTSKNTTNGGKDKETGNSTTEDCHPTSTERAIDVVIYNIADNCTGNVEANSSHHQKADNTDGDGNRNSTDVRVRQYGKL